MDEASGFFEEHSRAHLIVEDEKELSSLDLAITQKPPLQPKVSIQKKLTLQTNVLIGEGEKTLKPT